MSLDQVNDLDKKNLMITGGVVAGTIGLGIGIAIVKGAYDEVNYNNYLYVKEHDKGLRKMFSSRRQSKVSNIGNSERFKMSENPMYQKSLKKRNAEIAAREEAALEEAREIEQSQRNASARSDMVGNALSGSNTLGWFL